MVLTKVNVSFMSLLCKHSVIYNCMFSLSSTVVFVLGLYYVPRVQQIMKLVRRPVIVSGLDNDASCKIFLLLLPEQPCD